MVFPSFLIVFSKVAMEDNIADYFTDIESVKEGSMLEGLDKDNLSSFKKPVRNSVAYMALRRCEYSSEDYFESADFENTSLFNTIQTIAILGETSDDISRMILREIDSTVKSIEKEL